MTLRLVIDTNVLVSGVLNRHGPPGRIVDAVLDGRVMAVLDARVLAEYGAVMRRPRLRIRPDEAAALLDFLDHEGEVHLVDAAPLPFAMPDPDDAPFAEVALYACADALITGNSRDFEAMRVHGVVPVWTPRQAVDRIGDRS